MNDQAQPTLHSVVAGPAEDASRGTSGAALLRRVVFLHGLFGRGKNFTRIASGLEPEARSLLVDLPNHGRSEWTESVDYPEMADAVAAHLREGFAADGPVDVVGHSMGGKVAMVLALRHPELVRRLVVVDISPVAADAARGEFKHLLDSLATVDLAGLERRGQADEQLREAIPKDGVRGFLLQNLRREGEGFRWEPNLEMLRREIEAVMGFPDAGGAQFTGPVLWIAGERSDYVTREDGPAMRALFPKTTRMTVRGSGHWVHSEKPDEVIAALRSFLLTD
ncbi:alpha/beta fold hydrolase [Rothia santali]|uniref:alpha/beta fold hydrolase n=1 Tax=Rothia santali TaxID=2949643 RepID=UPI0035A0C4DB